ncbi:hypothetical protein WJX72_011964 [[Myrmecia] bisecta]|uniref:BTB domain-containing protein n=1 Tax=[Myrmecia] bisecta TaxID=41462 RepID=A0AAW1PYK5_9CHLO
MTTKDLLHTLVDLPVQQWTLHNIVRSLYSKTIIFTPLTVEAYYRMADYLQVPCIMEACIKYMRRCLPSAILGVHAFGCDMPDTQLQEAAEDYILRFLKATGWGVRMLADISKKSSDQHVSELLHRLRKVALSELQVVELLIEVQKTRPDFVFNIAVEEMHREEVACLARLLVERGRRDVIGTSKRMWGRMTARVLAVLVDASCLKPPGSSAVVALKLVAPANADTQQTICDAPIRVDGRDYLMRIEWSGTGGWNVWLQPSNGESVYTDRYKPIFSIFSLACDGRLAVCSNHSDYCGNAARNVGTAANTEIGCIDLKLPKLPIDCMDERVFIQDGSPHVTVGMHLYHAVQFTGFR